MRKYFYILWISFCAAACSAYYFSSPANLARISNSVPVIQADAYIDFSAVGEDVAITLANLNSSTTNLVGWGTNMFIQKGVAVPTAHTNGAQLTNLLFGTTTRGPNMNCKVQVGSRLVDATTTRYGCYYNMSVTNSAHSIFFTNFNVYGLAYGQYIKIGNDTSSGDQFVQGFCQPLVGTAGVWAYSEGSLGQIRVGAETSGGGQATIYTATGAGNGILLVTNFYYFYSFSYQAADTNTVPGVTNMGSVNIDVWSNNVLVGSTNLVVTNTSFIRQMAFSGRNSGENTHPNYTNDFGPILLRFTTNRGQAMTRFTPTQ